MVLLSIIIVNYNVKFFLEQCLCSLETALADIDAEVLVIDNCSADGSTNYLQHHFPWVSFIQNGKNGGFAKANNKALHLAKGKYILFLNPDTLLTEDTLPQCIDFFEKHKDAGAVGVRMIDGSGAFLPESKRAFPSPAASFYKLIGISSLFPKSRILNRYALGFLSETAVSEVDVLAGAFMMIKKSVLDKTGGFDERFFMYAEDIDLSYRIQQAGYKNYYLGNITIIHFKGESTEKDSLNYVSLFYQSMQLFVNKHYNKSGAWLISKGLYAGILLRQIVAALTLPFYKKRKKHSDFKPQKIYVTGDASQAEAAMRIIKRNHPKAIIQYVSSTVKNVEDHIIVFCTGSCLSYKEAIQYSQVCFKGSLLMWSGKGSGSIVGSSNKDTSGEVWY